MIGCVRERTDAKALSFVDDVAWWAEGTNETKVARKLTNAVTYAVEWASENAVAFGVDKNRSHSPNTSLKQPLQTNQSTLLTSACQLPVNTLVNAPVNTLVNTPHKYSWNQVLRIATCPNGSIGHQPNNGPPSPRNIWSQAIKKLAAPIISTGLRPVHCPASSFTQHTPTLPQQPTTTPSSYTCLSATILPLLHPHNTLPHSHNNQRQHCNTSLVHIPLHNMSDRRLSPFSRFYPVKLSC